MPKVFNPHQCSQIGGVRIADTTLRFTWLRVENPRSADYGTSRTR